MLARSYGSADAEALAQVIRACRQRGIRFIYGLAPGLDMRYGEESESMRLHDRVAQMLALGCTHIALLFDDISDRLDPALLTHWGSLAAAQCHVANALFSWMRAQRPDAHVAFCPTAYCGRMVQAQLGGAGYLETVGRTLAPDIDIFWTGPEIISREIPVAHVRELQPVLARRPLIWDNLHANDDDGRRFACGPYAGRPRELRAEVRGLLSNPNTECALNYVPLRTLAAFVHDAAPRPPRDAYLAAMQEWLPSFDTVLGPTDLDDLVLLGDCYYLPYEEGPRAVALHDQARRALTDRPDAWQAHALAFLAEAVRLRDLCARLPNLRRRDLFHALSPRIWDLREELDLLVRCVEARLRAGEADQPFRSDAHLPGTYRGGMLARLQALLIQHPDGTFTPAPATPRDA